MYYCENDSAMDRLILHLILNYHFAPYADFLNGKMGGVVFFGQYAQYTSTYREYGKILIFLFTIPDQ